MEEVIESEIKTVLASFQKDKIPGPDGWVVKFFLAFNDFMGSYLLQVVNEARWEGSILPYFNFTFIALITQLDRPSSLEDFRPISL